ncbi:hypothetical protein GCM10025867_10050 [Frondihabitans sucicola]|uniref:Uncharacterized protein n=1 Tax=Frondihabitans sucicola TaxID=1268041 RepID=A0ABM8GK48_9MICO|nr:hypothetical protein [Frondihabitans sucicola]BDZ48764.1 hypothetical protein GCM10025867_10050 [Frondihabitans sucicola]
MTISPIFDQLTNRRRSTFRPVDRSSTPVFASISESASPTARGAQPLGAQPQTTPPVTVHDLTADERELVAEMGGTVARLILRMLDDDTTKTRRWPFHAVK